MTAIQKHIVAAKRKLNKNLAAKQTKKHGN